MREFCPLCSKNGVKTKIKSYQLNFEEAVLMCSAEKCTWPVGYEDLTFITRSVGKDYSKIWDELTDKKLKSEQDTFIEFSAYTPPQTPGTEINCKDITNCEAASTAIQVPDKVFNPMPTLIKDNVHKCQEFSTAISKPNNLSLDINSINSYLNIKPKLVVSKLVNYAIKKPAKGYILIKGNETNNTLTVSNTQPTAVKMNVPIIKSTSSPSKLKANKSIKLNSGLDAIKELKEKPKAGLRTLSKKKKPIPYEKFDFNELLKAKNGKTKKDCEIENKVKKVEKMSECLEIKETKMEACPYDDFNLDELFCSDSLNTNVKSECKYVELGSSNGGNVDCNSSQAEFDLSVILGNNFEESRMDQESMDNVDLDLLLDSFADELGTPLKCNKEDTDDYKWISTLYSNK